MHAYLFVGNTDELITKISELSEKLDAKIIEFPLIKINDVRDLTNLIRLSFSERTLIICKNIERASEEALNAFLKSLEEPQKNIYFALTTENEKAVLSTIVSRCQIVKSTNLQISKLTNEEEVKQFLEMTKSEKLSFFDKLKERDKAIDFINDLIFYLHDKKDLAYMELLLKILTNLKKNGSVTLHLTNLVAMLK